MARLLQCLVILQERDGTTQAATFVGTDVSDMAFKGMAVTEAMAEFPAASLCHANVTDITDIARSFVQENPEP